MLAFRTSVPSNQPAWCFIGRHQWALVTDLRTNITASVTYNPPTYNSWLLSTGESDLVPNSANGKDYSTYLIDPPTYDIKDEITFKCSTKCPGAHGQTFEASGVVCSL